MNSHQEWAREVQGAWKVLANQVTIMPTKVARRLHFTYDSWSGYPREREELLTHIRDSNVTDVIVHHRRHPHVHRR